MVVLRRAMLGAGTHRDPVLSILSGDDQPEVQLICARPITSSLEPGVRILHRPCRPLLRGLEQAHRAALDDHVHRPTRLGQWVLISGSWYYGSDFALVAPICGRQAARRRRRARMKEHAECMLVIIGATPEGAKELVDFQV